MVKDVTIVSVNELTEYDAADVEDGRSERYKKINCLISAQHVV